MDRTIRQSEYALDYIGHKLFDSQFDPEGAGRIATEDFLLALNSKDFLTNKHVARKRPKLKAKVLEYGTSFITIEEFVRVVSDSTNITLNQSLLSVTLTSARESMSSLKCRPLTSKSCAGWAILMQSKMNSLFSYLM